MPPLTRICAILLLAPQLLGCSGASTPSPRANPLPPRDDRPRAPAPQAARLGRAKTSHAGGPPAAGRGDFQLHNQRLTIAVAGLHRRRPGSVLDAFATGGHDSLGQLALVAGSERMVPPRFNRLETVTVAGRATVRLHGTDPNTPGVALQHDLSLDADRPLLTLRTTVINRSKSTIARYQVGDHIDWGCASAFAPGLGYTPRGSPPLPWVGATSDSASYVYFGRGEALASTLAGQRAQLTLGSVDLPPGARRQLTRHLAVGRAGQLAQLLRHVLRAQGVAPVSVQVAVADETGMPAGGAHVTVTLGHGPLTVARSDSAGVAHLALAPGRYEVRAWSPGRTSPAATLQVSAAPTPPVRLRTSPPARLVYEVRQQGVGPTIAARITVQAVDQARSVLPPGQPCTLHSGPQLLTEKGSGVLPLPPGRYRVQVSAGPQRSLYETQVSLEPHQGGSVEAQLRRVVDLSSSHLAVDVSPVAARACPTAAILRQAAAASGIDALLLPKSSAGPQETRPSANALVPIAARSVHLPRLGRATWLPADALMTLPRLLRQPLRPARGLLVVDRLPTDPPPAVGAFRLLAPRHEARLERRLTRWLDLLRQGHTISLVAGALGEGCDAHWALGRFRTYVQRRPAPAPTTAIDLVRALRQGRSQISSGPLIRFSVNGKAPGHLLSLPRRRRRGGQPVQVQLELLAPAWMPLESLTLYVGGKPRGEPIPVKGSPDGSRLKRSITLRVSQDTFVLAVVRGGPLPAGTNREAGPRAVAITNPVWIDADGDGRLRPLQSSAASSSADSATRSSRREKGQRQASE